MRILSPLFVAHYEGSLVNIHPSLLPAFPGLHTHHRAIEAGCKFAGATTKNKCKKKRQATNRELLGTCANKNSIWSAKIRRLRKIKSSHKLGT